jgi:hypothetical protein
VTKRLAQIAMLLVAVSACGARTGLRADERRNAADDAATDEPAVPPDVIADAGIDVEDAAIDVVDARPDVIVEDCRDAGITYIYLIASENRLMRYDPPSGGVLTVGTIDCPVAGAATPYSMAVDRLGIAYVLFNDGQLFRVSTLTASCQPTAFVSGQLGFPVLFGMGFSANPADQGETLYVVGTGSPGSGAPLLASIDPVDFSLSVVGPLSVAIGDAELSGTGEARLFGFAPGPPTHLAEIEPSSGTVISDVLLDLNQTSTSAWAFAFWGGEFYFFTSRAQGSSTIHRYTPGGATTVPQIGTVGVTIVGAGVSTCAPSK